MSKNYKENDSLSFLEGLNEEQKAAVKDCHFPQLILSGPGAGKTTVLIKKIIYLMEIKKISPENILALTFTRKAADEMRQRMTEFIGDRNAKKLEMGTFLSIFSKIVNKNISSLSSNYISDFKIIEEKEVNKIIKNIIKTHFKHVNIIVEKKESNDKVIYYYELDVLVKRIAKKIMLLKNKGITYKDYNKKMEKLIMIKKKD
jgi:superfamily I DNA/RNA helicase